MRLRAKNLQSDDLLTKGPHADRATELDMGSPSVQAPSGAQSQGEDLSGSKPCNEGRRAHKDGRRKDFLGSMTRMVFGGGLFLLMIFFVVMFLFGFRTYAITGGSMSGTIDRGALIIDRIVPVGSLETEDIITFRPPGQRELVTHRIVSVESHQGGQTAFRTKGDANESADPWQFTLDSDRQAKYVFHIPYLGYALLIFGTPLVRSALLGALALLLVLSLFLSLWRQAGESPPHPGVAPVSGLASEPDDDPDDPRPLRRTDRRS